MNGRMQCSHELPVEDWRVDDASDAHCTGQGNSMPSLTVVIIEETYAR